jgi:hypothetical protein
MRLSKIMQVAILALAFASPALADNPSTGPYSSGCTDSAMAEKIKTDAANRAKQLEKNIASNWKNPSSFNSLYCGVQITSMFDQIGTGLGGSIYSMINSLLTNLINQACASAIAPIQNAASQLCIPFFSAANFNLSLGLPGMGSGGYCNGMQLLSVTPVTSRPNQSSPNYGPTPLLP